jgi:hypothetical protein
VAERRNFSDGSPSAGITTPKAEDANGKHHDSDQPQVGAIA